MEKGDLQGAPGAGALSPSFLVGSGGGEVTEGFARAVPKLMMAEQRAWGAFDAHGATVGWRLTCGRIGSQVAESARGPSRSSRMEKTPRRALLLGSFSAFAVLACSPEAPEHCTLADPRGSCAEPLVCEAGPAEPLCVAPLIVRGKVSDAGGNPIADALITALDANGAPASGTAVSGPDGIYELWLPAPRDADGVPLIRPVRLRASSAGFEPFPSGLRRSLPIELSGASASAGRLLLENAATHILLTSIPDADGLATIVGTVEAPAGRRGALVVAEGPVVVTAVSDTDGAFTLFNVPPGVYEVRGYAAGIQLLPTSSTVAAGQRLDGLTLATRDLPLGSVAGNVAIVNAPGDAATSVVLVVASTFNQGLARGEVPPGLRAPGGELAPNVDGAFTIADVPDGDYVVLAAFENDDLVRDPDTSIGGTQIQRVTVGPQGRAVTLEAGFKITQALAVRHPGAGDLPDLMTGLPSFKWEDDSSEDRYLLEVVDAKGTTVWSTDVPKQTGGDVSATYTGPPLAAGSLYQFRVTSFRRGDVPISSTEDLRGVFAMP